MPQCKFCNAPIVYMHGGQGVVIAIDAVMRKLYLAADIDEPARFGLAKIVTGYTNHASICPHQNKKP